MEETWWGESEEGQGGGAARLPRTVQCAAGGRPLHLAGERKHTSNIGPYRDGVWLLPGAYQVDMEFLSVCLSAVRLRSILSTSPAIKKKKKGIPLQKSKHCTSGSTEMFMLQQIKCTLKQHLTVLLLTRTCAS